MILHAGKDLLLLTDVSLLEEEDLFSRAYAAVPADRQKKTDRMRMPADKRLSLGAGLLLRRAMGLYGIPADAAFAETGNQKPVLRDYPDFHFNLSHSGTLALCAVAETEVGCDVERVRPDSLAIAKRFFLPAEYAYITSFGTAAEQEQMFFRFWTMKEAYMKATAKGMQLPPDAFEILPPQGEEEGFSVRQNGKTVVCRLAEFGQVPGYCISVCTVGAAFRAELQVKEISRLL